MTNAILKFCNTSGWFTSSDPTIPKDRLIQKVIACIPVISLFSTIQMEGSFSDQTAKFMSIEEWIKNQIEQTGNALKTIKLFNIAFHYKLAELVNVITVIGLCILGLACTTVAAPQVLIYGIALTLALTSIDRCINNLIDYQQSINKLTKPA